MLAESRTINDIGCFLGHAKIRFSKFNDLTTINSFFIKAMKLNLITETRISLLLLQNYSLKKSKIKKDEAIEPKLFFLHFIGIRNLAYNFLMYLL